MKNTEEERRTQQTSWSRKKTPATNKEKQKASILRHQRGIVKEIPAEFLSTAITERLILAFQIAMATRTDWKYRAGMVEGKMLPVVPDLHSNAVGKFFVRSGEPEQIIR